MYKRQGVFRTREYTYDAKILLDYFLEELKKYPNEATIKYGVDITTKMCIRDRFRF